MNYEHKSNVRNNNIPVTFKVLGLAVLFIVIIYVFFPKILPSFFTKVAVSFWNIKKEATLESLELQDVTILTLQKENSDLKSLLHRSATSTSGTLAYIIKKPPYTAYDSYIINVGDGSDITVGDKVYAIGNILLGEIAEKVSSTARVKLYSTHGEKYEVFIGKKNIQGTATGKGGGSFEIVLPRDTKIVVGDMVTIPDLYPSVFGIVRVVDIDAARSFSRIVFSQPINIYEQKWVEIRKK